MFVNGAQGGRTADRWVDPAAPTWDEVDRRWTERDLTPLQVEVAWVKQTLTRGGAFPEKALELEEDLQAIVRNLHLRYPNLKLVFLSSRTRSYLYDRGLSPEPAAFETGFAVKWLIEAQIAGDPALNYDPERGPVVAPYLAWGPYLWIDGANPRSDGMTWTAEDLAEDCTHPSASGTEKVAGMLRAFFLNDSLAAGWFGVTRAEPTQVPTAEPTVATDTPRPIAASPTPAPAVTPGDLVPATPAPETPAVVPTALLLVGAFLLGAASAVIVTRRRS